MALTFNQFVEYLIDEINDGNDAFVDDLLTAAKEKITEGGGIIDSMTSGSKNGKSYTLQIGMDAATVAAACRKAKRATTATDGDPDFITMSFTNI